MENGEKGNVVIKIISKYLSNSLPIRFILHSNQ
jgi:hypothetical protein